MCTDWLVYTKMCTELIGVNKFESWYHTRDTFIKNTVKKDGLNLYRGFSLTFAASFVPTAIYIYAYEKGMRFV